MNGALFSEMWIGALVPGLHCIAKSALCMRPEDRTRSPLVATPKHALANHAGDGARDVDHRLQFRPGDLILIAKANAITPKGRADLVDVACRPGLHHRFETLLRKEKVLQPKAVIRMRRSKLGDNLVVSGTILHVTKAVDLVALLLKKSDEVPALLHPHSIGGLLQTMADGTGVQSSYSELVGVHAERNVGHLLRLWVVARAHAGLGIVDHDLVQVATGRSDVVIFHLLRHGNHSEVSFWQALLVHL
mmetsp:Transcript_83787/g.201016  ORF Transcript_83787/g.201016 Transcript_83787/m.201016 type:complete len:247 (-) Transcript_83787:445-1185(-)